MRVSGVSFAALLALLAVARAAYLSPHHAVKGAAAADDPFSIPDSLLIGAGVSAIQTEGAWNVSGKGESAADYVLHLGKLDSFFFLNDSHAHDVAADSYKRFKEDVAMAAKLKLKLYRFSISWSRVLPTADANFPNPDGVKFYHELIDEILLHGMTPMATLYHFDHPEILEQQFKGWQDEKMVPKFVEYARFAFNEYASKVKLWTTINEPNMYCTYFPSLFHASGLYTDEDMDQYKCMRHTILAHADSYHAFKDDGHEGQVGFTALIMHTRPNSTRPEDVYAAEAFNQMYTGQVLHPVVHGDYPQLVKTLAAGKVTAFDADQQKRIAGTTDFIGLNVYYGMIASYVDPASGSDSPFSHVPILGTMMLDMPFVSLAIAGVDLSNIMAMFSIVDPDSIRSAVLWTWESYNKPIAITENGFGDMMGLGIKDHKRAEYHSAFLRELVSTMKVFKIDVIAYCVWSLIDSFEWSAGYTRPFGLVHIDYEGGTLDRTLKDSSSFWIEMGDTGIVPYVAPADDPTDAPPTNAPPSAAFRPATSSLLVPLPLLLLLATTAKLLR